MSHHYSNLTKILKMMLAGIRPEELKPDEMRVLESEYGINWKEKLGCKDKINS
jgi:hypothetical protein